MTRILPSIPKEEPSKISILEPDMRIIKIVSKSENYTGYAKTNAPREIMRETMELIQLSCVEDIQLDIIISILDLFGYKFIFIDDQDEETYTW